MASSKVNPEIGSWWNPTGEKFEFHLNPPKPVKKKGRSEGVCTAFQAAVGGLGIKTGDHCERRV